MERGSRFYAHAFPVKREEEIKAILQELKLKYPDASHHCFVWILNPDKSGSRLNDDGEPSGSAAKPIWKQIHQRDLTNILLVVVRYFGGKKLGIPGLISAYGNTAGNCLDKAKISSYTLRDYYKVTCDISWEHKIYNLARLQGARIESNEKTDRLIIVLSTEVGKGQMIANEVNKLANFELKFLKTE